MEWLTLNIGGGSINTQHAVAITFSLVGSKLSAGKCRDDLISLFLSSRHSGFPCLYVVMNTLTPAARLLRFYVYFVLCLLNQWNVLLLLFDAFNHF